MGYTAPALVNYMTLLGWTAPDSTKEIFTLEEAAKEFSFERVNKAGAKFDWDKLNWLNSQYLHKMPVDELLEQLIPYWQEAGYEFDPVSDRPWLQQLTSLLAASLVRLQDAVEMSRIFFSQTVAYSEEALTQLQQEGSDTAFSGILNALENHQSLSVEVAQDIIKQVTKEKNLKKGLVMRSLRAALTGELHGPDLMESWAILNQRGLDKLRLNQALEK
jgi:glutamyl-tRNA synthetase